MDYYAHFENEKRFREVKKAPSSYMASKWERSSSNSGLFDSKMSVFFSCLQISS